MPKPKAEAPNLRVIAHFDLDCFYVQVEQRRRPELKGKPTAVVQYNPWKGGGLIAVGYEARKCGVTRNMRGDEARAECPDVHLVQVPVSYGKANLTIYRDAGNEVVAILQRLGRCQKASIDEAYVDLTASVCARLQREPPFRVEDVPAGALASHVIGLAPCAGGSAAGVGAVGATAGGPHDSSSCGGGSDMPYLQQKQEQQQQEGEEQQQQQEGEGKQKQEREGKREQQEQQQQQQHQGPSSRSESRSESEEACVTEWLRASVLPDADASHKMLACGAVLVAELRAAVLAETGFTCSGGVAHNKMLAKLASGLHKPAQQTVVPPEGVLTVLESLPIRKMKQLGGKLGQQVQEQLGARTMGELLPHSLAKLQHLFGANSGEWVYNACRGLDGEEVEDRVLPKSHSSGKTFTGHAALLDLSTVDHWLSELAGELQGRLDLDLEQNGRTFRILTVHVSFAFGVRGEVRAAPSRSMPLRYGADRVAHDVSTAVKRLLAEHRPPLPPHPPPPSGGRKALPPPWSVGAMFIAASHVEEAPSGTASIRSFFSRAPPQEQQQQQQEQQHEQHKEPLPRGAPLENPAHPSHASSSGAATSRHSTSGPDSDDDDAGNDRGNKDDAMAHSAGEPAVDVRSAQVEQQAGAMWDAPGERLGASGTGAPSVEGGLVGSLGAGHREQRPTLEAAETRPGDEEPRRLTHKGKCAYQARVPGREEEEKSGTVEEEDSASHINNNAKELPPSCPTGRVPGGTVELRGDCGAWEGRAGDAGSALAAPSSRGLLPGDTCEEVQELRQDEEEKEMAAEGDCMISKYGGYQDLENLYVRDAALPGGSGGAAAAEVGGPDGDVHAAVSDLEHEPRALSGSNGGGPRSVRCRGRGRGNAHVAGGGNGGASRGGVSIETLWGRAKTNRSSKSVCRSLELGAGGWIGESRVSATGERAEAPCAHIPGGDGENRRQGSGDASGVDFRHVTYGGEEIDAAILAELPADIREELRLAAAAAASAGAAAGAAAGPKRQKVSGPRPISFFFRPPG